MIEAAGVVLIRAGNEPKVLIIRRDYRNDWSLPKGKLEPAELAAIAAVRETLEETGYLVKLETALKPISYESNGRPKTVYYWSASELAFDHNVVPNDEVSQLRWVTLAEATDLLTYEHDVAVVTEALALTNTGVKTAIVLRHAISTKREEFHGDNDLLRPLAPAGFSQLPQISALLAAYGVTTLISSPAIRCRQTLEHYCIQEGLAIAENPLLLEENEDFTQAEWDALLTHHSSVALCTHRPVIDELAEFEPDAADLLIDLPPAGVVVLSWNYAGELISAERHLI